jgi:hypothetical protein
MDSFLTIITEMAVEKAASRTSSDEGHFHTVKVNVNGDGKTVKTDGADDHIHEIVQWMVQEENGHAHDIEGI